MTKSTKKNLGFPPEIVRFVGKKWVIPLFKEFENNPQIRFGEIKQKFGITSKVLSEVLDEMKKFRFINKQGNKSFPPSTTYTLTDRGLSLLDVIDKLELFSKEHEIRENERNSGDTQYLTKFVIMLAIEKSLVRMGKPEYNLVENRLLSEFDCTFEDCVSNPIPLKKVLSELFGNCYEDIYNSMYNALKDTMDVDIKNFLKIMRDE
ncbi:MAG: winged helix-turn-helix transcriptional regulator [Nitrosopumilus sp.]